MLIEENALDRDGLERWIFCRGMRFNSPDKWWGDHGRRDFPHEGIDLCLYRDNSRKIRRLDENTRIPVMHNGVVKAMFRDYLGQAVVIEHEYADINSECFISVYAHTQPRAAIGVGTIVKEGDIIANLADTSHSKANILPHLHFSLGIPSKSLSYDGFFWNIIRRPEMVTLLDPLAVIDWPYQDAETENSDYCNQL